MANENPTFQIPRDVIEPIIQAHVTTAITGALSGYKNLVEKTVSYILNQTVDDRGKPSNYSGCLSFLDWALRDSIEKAVKELLAEALEKNKATLLAEIKKELQKKNSPMVRQLAESMVGSLTTAMKWNFKLSVNIGD